MARGVPQQHVGGLGFDVMLHEIPIVATQLNHGMYSLKRLHKFSNKLAQIEDSYARELMKLSESLQNDKLEDMMTNTRDLIIGVQRYASDTSNVHRQFKDALTLGICSPVSAMQKVFEGRRQLLSKQYADTEKQIVDKRVNLTKQKRLCMRLWTELSELKMVTAESKQALENMNQFQDTEDKALKKVMKTIVNTEKKVKKVAEQTRVSFEKYQTMVEDFKAMEREYHSKVYPALLAEMQQFERERMAVVKVHCEKFSSFWLDICDRINRGPASPTAAAKAEKEGGTVVLAPVQLSQAAQDLDETGGVMACVTAWLQEYGMAPQEPVFTIQYDLPCPPAHVAYHSVHADRQSPLPRKATRVWRNPKKSAAAAVDQGPKFISLAPIYVVSQAWVPQYATDVPLQLGDLVEILARDVQEAEPYVPASSCMFGVVLERDYAIGTFPSSCVSEVPLDNSLPLQYLLHMPEGLKAFEAHCQKEFSSENLDFWKEATRYRKSRNCLTATGEQRGDNASGEEREALLKMAQSITATFIGAEATRPVNLPGAISSTILSDMKAGKVFRRLFLEAEVAVYQLLEANNFRSFQKVPAYKLLLRQLNGGPSVQPTMRENITTRFGEPLLLGKLGRLNRVSSEGRDRAPSSAPPSPPSPPSRRDSLALPSILPLPPPPPEVGAKNRTETLLSSSPVPEADVETDPLPDDEPPAEPPS